jgi:hypothetical protein
VLIYPLPVVSAVQRGDQPETWVLRRLWAKLMACEGRDSDDMTDTVQKKSTVKGRQMGAESAKQLVPV